MQRPRFLAIEDHPFQYDEEGLVGFERGFRSRLCRGLFVSWGGWGEEKNIISNYCYFLLEYLAEASVQKRMGFMPRNWASKDAEPGHTIRYEQRGVKKKKKNEHTAEGFCYINILPECKRIAQAFLRFSKFKFPLVLTFYCANCENGFPTKLLLKIAWCGVNGKTQA